MSINVTVKQDDVEASLRNPPNIHYIPATIRGDGPAKVHQYFNSYTEELEDETLVNALRGYPLRGKHLNLPDGYSGIILQETQKPLSEHEERKFTFGGAFKQFTYWNYDKIPSRNDPLVKALDWIKVSQVLHEPLDADEIKQPNVKEE
ncbi:uncharacterized protein LOC129723227 [Wyeomyia smithii]|uniref:uncharacterized protein LOC129723227 n=1 Tax=Wyeomyia smithii TaxID=174621 RepID=UPI002467F5B9|nr:uncharacterized protein LOC129723227 [Wyeomyia smithii]